MTDSSYCSYDNVSESCNNVFNLTLSFDNDNTLDDLSFVDLAVINMMNRNSSSVDDSAKVDLMKSDVNGLYEQLSILKDQIVFLKADSNAKQSTVSVASLMNYPNHEKETFLIILYQRARVCT